MRNEILKRLISSISVTTLAATSLGLNTVLAANAENTNPVANVNETEELTEVLCHDHECEEHDHDDCCEHSHGGKGVTIALLDAGVTNFETSGKTSFIDDDTIGSDHGNDMISIISNVAPEADVLDVRVLDDEGHGTYSTVEKGIRWSVDNNADIIVMSFVGENQSSLLEDALAYAEEHEVLVVASAGNYSDNKALYPAAYPTVISVGALDENGNIQDYSNFGEYVNTYVEWSDGTSGAAQYIAATAAVTMEQNPDITVSELRASYNAYKSAAAEASNEENADTVVYSAAKCTQHTFNGSYVTTKNATCTTKGEMVGKCTKCGEVVNTVEISPLGHDYVNWITTKEASCKSAGSRTGTCKRCKRVQTISIPKHPHTFNGSYSNIKKATCTTAGSQVAKCEKCGEVIRTDTIPAYGHDYGSWVTTKEPTCTRDGSRKRTCKNCGNVQTVTISAFGHHLSWVVTKAATCADKGVKQYKCSVCAYVSDQQYIDKKAHTFNGSFEEKQPTCTVDGYKKSKCTKCGEIVQTTVIPKLSKNGHNAGESYITKQPTCTASGKKVIKCKRCNVVLTEVTIPKTGHNYVYDSKTLSMKCSVCGNPYYASPSTTWENYVAKCGVNYLRFSTSDKEKFAKNYLEAKGCNTKFINNAFEMSKNNNTIAVKSYDWLKKAITHINLFSDKAGYEFAESLTRYLGYGALGADTIVFLATDDDSYANIDKTIDSLITVSSDLACLLPIVGYTYSEIVAGLIDPLNAMIERVQNYNNKIIENTILLADVEEAVPGYHGNYTDLSDPVVYKAMVEYVDEHEEKYGHGYKYAKGLVDYYIYSSMNKDVKNATGMSIEEIMKKAK